ncbi:hypothetical protein [Vibrio alginolyticus]|uniref:hypothetical protein n=1 Tax=Vibrio alginolyticus TaxID=663 RepID=UPI0027E3DB7E|nr:hypothetical protein [Vibrio alginolyticus]WMO21451.1 hypothetical protein NI375_24575 [Vibrio alginolyticus]
MLDTQEQIEQFRQFLDVGGLKEAENLTREKSLKVKCESLSGKLSGCVSEDIDAMIIASKEERTLALGYFTKAISFTICSNQTKKTSIKDATAEVFRL